jgi:hypothetical protein
MPTHPKFLNELFSDSPKLHHGETEIARTPERSESGLDDEAWSRVPWNATGCFGITRAVGNFLDENVKPGWTTLETGCGRSTLIFANAGALHRCVTPSESEISELRAWASAHNVDLSRTTFVNKPSEQYLPTCNDINLDCAFIDGKHAFPWPAIDYFFSAQLLKRGGLMILDDTNLAPVEIVTEFLKEDTPRWELIADIGTTSVFRKLVDDISDVAWHMQPFATRRLPPTPRGINRILSGIKRRISG